MGPKPLDSPSLMDDQAEFQAIADQLWAGKGKVYGSQTIAQALAALQVAPDFAYAKPQADTTLMFVHRKLADGEIYWVNNRKQRAETVEATFRVQGKEAELWHADSGRVEPASYRIDGAATTVPLRLDPNDAVFVVFRKAAVAAVSHRGPAGGNAAGHGGGPLGGQLPARPRRTGQDYAGQADFVERERRRRREVLLRHGHLQ